MTRVRYAYGVAVPVLVIAYFVLPPARAVLLGAIGLAAVSAVEYGVRRLRPQRSGAWHLIALTLALLAVGDIVFVVLESGADSVPFPSVPDIFYVAAYPPLTVGLFWIGRPVTRHSDETTLIDSLSITLAGSLVVWILLVRPTLESAHIGTLGRAVAVVGWVGYIAVLAASVRALFCWRRNASMTMLGAAVLAFLISDLFYGKAIVHGTWSTGGVVDLGYFIFTGLCGAAALHPSMRDVASPLHARHKLGPGRLTLIAVALLVAPTVLLVEAGRGMVTGGVAIAIVSGVVSGLLLLRLSMTGRAFQRRARREYAVRRASQVMVTATRPDEVLAGTRAALRRVTAGRVQAELVRPLDPGRTVREVQGPVGGPGELVIPLAGTDAALVFHAQAYELHELHELLDSLADQAALALSRIDLMEQNRVEERERYFRTLVMTSTDVIMISRGGRIDYATPSATSMFGRDVLGEHFDDLVRPTREGMARRPELGSDGDGRPHWPDSVRDGAEGIVTRGDGEQRTVLVQRRDLTGDPTVAGVVTTLRDVTEERALRSDLTYRASHDEMTGLANSRAWVEAITAEGDRRRATGEGIAVIFIDLDNFKQINDRFGHPVGDQVLAEVARRIRASLRVGDVAARVGGDEFAALLRGLSSVEDARRVASRLAGELARPAEVDAVAVECQSSIGLAYTEGREQVSVLVRQADTALYAAKEQGKGRWAEYSPMQWRPARRTPDGQTQRASSIGEMGRTIR